jgi:hypothetical protein
VFPPGLARWSTFSTRAGPGRPRHAIPRRGRPSISIHDPNGMRCAAPAQGSASHRPVPLKATSTGPAMFRSTYLFLGRLRLKFAFGVMRLSGLWPHSAALKSAPLTDISAGAFRSRFQTMAARMRQPPGRPRLSQGRVDLLGQGVELASPIAGRKAVRGWRFSFAASREPHLRQIRFRRIPAL